MGLFTNQYSKFDDKFSTIGFDNSKTIQFIQQILDSNCKPFDHGFIFNHGKNIAVIMMFIPYNPSTHSIHPFHDTRTFHMRLANAIKYCILNQYTLIYFYKSIWRYNGNISSDFNRFMDAIMWQKPFALNYFIKQFEWIIWLDFDTMFYDCNQYKSLEKNILQYAIRLHSNHTNNGSLISIIFAGEERFTVLNAGCLIMKKSIWSQHILDDWMYITEHASNYILLKWDAKFEQKIISALLQGFDYRIMDKQQMEEYWSRCLRKFYRRNKDKYPNSIEWYYIYPDFPSDIAQRAVAIHQTIINEHIPNILKRGGTTNQTVVAHFNGRSKYNSNIWKVFALALSNCET